MYSSPSINVPSSRRIPCIFPCLTSIDKFLCSSLSPASLHSLSPASIHSLSSGDTTDGDDLPEQELWCIRKKTKSYSHASLLPRVSAKSGFVRSPSAANIISTSSDMMHSPVSLVCESGGESKARASNGVMEYGSGPLKIPDRSMVCRCNGKGEGDDEEEEKEEEGDDDEVEQFPPHEYLARQYTKNGRIPFSVLEGAGRTLKGHDLCRVRNAVLTRTGFMD